MRIEDLLRPDIAAMEAYTPILPFEVVSARLGRQPSEIIKLDANENPYGPSPRVRAALADLPWPHIYPFHFLAEFLRISAEEFSAHARTRSSTRFSASFDVFFTSPRIRC